MHDPTLDLWRYFSQALALLDRPHHYLMVWRTGSKIVRVIDDRPEDVKNIPKVLTVRMVKAGLLGRFLDSPGYVIYRITAAGKDVLRAGSDEIDRLSEDNERLLADLAAKPTVEDIMAVAPEQFAGIPVPEGLTGTQTTLFVKLFQSLGRVVPKESIEATLYPGPEERIGNNVSVQISHLRKKLDGGPWRIETVWGRGFKLVSLVPVEIPRSA